MSKTDERKLKRKRGFGLVVIIGFAAIMIVFTAGVGAQAASNLSTVRKKGEIDRAYYAAYTGVQLTVSLLREPPPPYPGDPEWIVGDRNLTLRFDDGTDAVAKLFHNIPSLPGATPDAPDGTVIPQNHFYIVSMGVVNPVYDGLDLISGTKFETSAMGAALKAAFPTLPQAAFATDTTTTPALAINGEVNHFDSRATPPYTVSDVTSGYPEASVATDALVATAVDVGGEARIDGHLLLGPGATNTEVQNVVTAVADTPLTAADSANPPLAFETSHTSQGLTSSSLSPNTKISGRVSVLGSARSVVDMTPDPALTSYEIDYPASTSFGSIQTLKEGKIYHHQGDLTVNSGGGFVVGDDNGDGKIEDVLFLVEGDITFSGSKNKINEDSPPRRLKFYSLAPAASPSTFTMTNSDAFCMVAGENMNVVIDKQSELWGAVLGKTVQLQGDATDKGKIHYDVALRDPILMGDTYGFTVLSTNSSGSSTKIRVSELQPTGTVAPVAPAPTTVAPTTVAPTTVAPTTVAPTTAPATGGCGGCGCCGGSMMLALKQAMASE